MRPFEVTLPKRIVFGRNRAKPAMTGIAQVHSRPFIVHGRSADRAAWLIDLYKLHGWTAPTVACASEPDLALLEAALGQLRESDADCVIGIGGGAALDLAKAVAGLARTQKPLMTYLEVVGSGEPLDAAPLPFIAIPTTSGTGAEVTRNAVIGVPEHQRKVSLRDVGMIADVAIVDPSLTDSAPIGVTLASGLDAITQLIEPYLSTRANAFTDALAARALEPALAAIRTLANREKPDARDAMAFASHSSGICLSHSGLGAVHGLAGPIGGMTGAPHGEICATLLGPALTVNRNAMAAAGVDTGRLDDIDTLLADTFGDMPGKTGTGRLSAWAARNGIRTPQALGLPSSRFAEAADMAAASSSMQANPVTLKTDELVEILAMAGEAR